MIGTQVFVECICNVWGYIRFGFSSSTSQVQINQSHDYLHTYEYISISNKHAIDCTNLCFLKVLSVRITFLLHFVAFFHVASLFSTGVENKKVGVDNKKGLELTSSTVFHRGRQ